MIVIKGKADDGHVNSMEKRLNRAERDLEICIRERERLRSENISLMKKVLLNK
jgi:hypothetical protein